MAVPLSFGIVRPIHAPWVRLTRSINPFCAIHCCSKRVISLEPYRPSIAPFHGVQAPAEQSEIIFIGTGTSEGIPRVSCLTHPIRKCKVCSKATESDSKNRRLNTSLLVRYLNPSGKCNILIDAGKIRRTLDAVIITHSHADAIGGLDDLRDWTNNIQQSIPVYTAERDFEVMKKTHYYVVDTSSVTAGAAVSTLQFNIIQEEPFTVRDLEFTPLPVWHGCGYRSLGFRFGNICCKIEKKMTEEDNSTEEND